MSRDRYRDAARLLGGKHRPGIPGVKAAHVWGTLDDVDFEFTWTWDLETERKGFLGRKEHTNVRHHNYRFDCSWADQPMTINRTGGRIVATPAAPGDDPSLTPEQRDVLENAFAAWPGLRVTSHGYEWSTPDRDDTAQQIAVAVQGLAKSLQSLVPEPSSRTTKPKRRLRFRKKLANGPEDSGS